MLRHFSVQHKKTEKDVQAEVSTLHLFSHKNRCWSCLFWLQVSVSITSSFICLPYTCRKISLLQARKVFTTLMMLFNLLISKLATMYNYFPLLYLFKVPQKMLCSKISVCGPWRSYHYVKLLKASRKMFLLLLSQTT